MDESNWSKRIYSSKDMLSTLIAGVILTECVRGFAETISEHRRKNLEAKKKSESSGISK